MGDTVYVEVDVHAECMVAGDVGQSGVELVVGHTGGVGVYFRGADAVGERAALFAGEIYLLSAAEFVGDGDVAALGGFLVIGDIVGLVTILVGLVYLDVVKIGRVVVVVEQRIAESVRHFARNLIDGVGGYAFLGLLAVHCDVVTAVHAKGAVIAVRIVVIRHAYHGF